MHHMCTPNVEMNQSKVPLETFLVGVYPLPGVVFRALLFQRFHMRSDSLVERNLAADDWACRDIQCLRAYLLLLN